MSSATREGSESPGETFPAGRFAATPAHDRHTERLALCAAVALAGLLAASLLIVVIAADRPSFLVPVSRPHFFPAWLAGPLGGLWPGLTADTNVLAWLISGVMAVMYGLYALAARHAWRLRARWSVLTVLSLHSVFLLSPPLPYTDVFNYVNYGRMGVIHHLNPYVTVPLLGPHADPSFSLSNWHLLLSPYGPLFTLFTYALVPLGVAASFWALKLVIALASLGTLALVWRCAQLLGRSPSNAIVYVGCNPIVLVWGLGADHNDALMVFAVALSTYLVLRGGGRSLAAGGVALVGGAFVKASALVLLPVFLAATRSTRFLRGAAAAVAVLGAISLLFFGAHPPNLSTQSELVTGVGLPNLLGLALGQGGESAAVHLGVTVVLVLTLCSCAVWAARRRGDWLRAGGVSVLALIASLSWAAPWYLLWVLPFAALADSAWLRRLVLVFGAYSIVVFMPAAPLLARAVHFAPEATKLGAEHRARIERLVR